MSFSDLIRDQLKSLPIVLTTSNCSGKTYIVTGANTGLGYECAKHLVKLSAAKVILGVRSLSKGNEAKAQLESDTGRHGVVEVWQLDLSSYSSVKEFADRVKGLVRVDTIIENAGIALDRKAMAEGLEATLTTNVVSNFLLAILVLPKLQETAKMFGTTPHLVVVGSDTALRAKGGLEQVNGDILIGLTEGPIGTERYPVSKLLELYGVRQLASLRPTSDTGVVINYVNPGLCRTELSRHVSFAFRLLIKTAGLLLGRTAEEGSKNYLYAAAAGEESHGKYLSDCEIKDYRVPSWVTDESGREIQTRVWESISKQLNSTQPGCI